MGFKFEKDEAIGETTRRAVAELVEKLKENEKIKPLAKRIDWDSFFEKIQEKVCGDMVAAFEEICVMLNKKYKTLPDDLRPDRIIWQDLIDNSDDYIDVALQFLDDDDEK
ncbi:MAG: hypothetical protein N2558_04670 [Patescibacteria group bacterium]|nr:hypothetical protein [Patescibacteria group bacterium]